VKKIKKLIFIILMTLLNLTETNAVIKDSLFATVGNKAITQSDIINEIKIVLILSEKKFSEENRSMLEQAGIQQLITRNVKKIEIEKYESLDFNKEELNSRIKEFANSLNVSLEDLKNIFSQNKVNFEILVDNIKTDLLWNSLIFQLYKNRLSINVDEIEEQLKQINTEKKSFEYLLAEIIVKPIPKRELELGIKKIKNKIETEGFENTARSISIASTASNGGKLTNWLSDKSISQELNALLSNTKIGNVAEPIFIPQGIVFFKVLDKKSEKEIVNLEEEKDKLVNFEKQKILNMHAVTHYDKLRRSVAINYY